MTHRRYVPCKHAEAIVSNIVEKVKNYAGTVIFTRDTHFADYMDTQEGKNLPVKHCIKDTTGWEICNELKPYVNKVIDKITFGSVDLPDIIKAYGEQIDEIELCGLCTDICVITNALKSSREKMKNEIIEEIKIREVFCSVFDETEFASSTLVVPYPNGIFTVWIVVISLLHIK